MSQYEGVASQSAAHCDAFSRLHFFQLCNAYLVYLLAGSMLTALTTVIQTPSALVEQLAAAVPPGLYWSCVWVHVQTKYMFVSNSSIEQMELFLFSVALQCLVFSLILFCCKRSSDFLCFFSSRHLYFDICGPRVLTKTSPSISSLRSVKTVLSHGMWTLFLPCLPLVLL